MAAVPDSHRAPREAPGLFDLVGQTFKNARSLVSDYATLAVLDARRAGIKLAWLLSCGLIVAVLVVTAWMAGVAAIIVWMMGEGVSWVLAFLCGAGLNLVGAGALIFWMRHLVQEMPFTALLRQLKGENPPPSVDPSEKPEHADAKH